MRAFYCAACALVALALGCSEEDTEPITNTITCADVCDRYQECVNDDLDVSECTTDCEDSASDNEGVEARLESCEECLNEKSCADSVFRCSAECVGLLVF